MALFENDLQLNEIWAVLRRRRWIIYLAVVASTLVALLASFMATPTFRSTVTLQIERRNPDILNMRDLGETDYSWAAYENFYQTQYQVLQSDTVSRLAVQRLNLASHPSLQGEKKSPSLLSRVRNLLPGTGSGASLSREDVATRWVRSGLQVAPVQNSHLVEVSWTSTRPELASQVANAVAEAYIQFTIESRYTTTDQAAEFLVDQVGALKEEIADLEDRLREYGSSKSIVSVDDSSNITLQALSDIAKRRTAAQATLAEEEASYRTVLAAAPETLPEVADSNLIARLKQEYAAHEADYLEMSRQFKDDWPELRALRTKLDGARDRLDSEIQEIAEQVVATAEAEFEQARSEVANLDRLLADHQEAAQVHKRDAVGYTTLMAEVERKRETLDALITRQSEMALSTRLKDLDVTSSNVRIVDRARPAIAPFSPRKKTNVTMGLFVGLAIGIGLAFVLDYLDNTVSAPAEIERLTRLPSLAMIPRHGESSSALSRVRRRPVASVADSIDLITHRDGMSETAEAFRELRTSILLSSPGHAPRLISITSALPTEGKSSTAVNLAVVLSQLGRRVLLIDTDLRRPRLHRVFKVANRRGVSTVLAGQEEDPATVVTATGIENLDLIPSGPIPPNPSELLNSPVFGELGARLLDLGYEHVVYDSPPALSVTDAVIVASVMDITLVVARADRTPRESLRHAVERLTQAGTRPVGIVVNDVAAATDRYARYRYYGQHDSTAGTGSPEPETPKGGRSKRAGSA
jgi:capsular exopolysaccharide synthesis family protein